MRPLIARRTATLPQIPPLGAAKAAPHAARPSLAPGQPAGAGAGASAGAGAGAGAGLGAPRGARKAARRDPAPSRWSYRWQRLWLTPAFRALVRTGLPVLAVVTAGGLWLHDADRRAALVGLWDTVDQAFRSRPEFTVALMSVEGASPVLADSIRRALDLKLPTSSFEIDLAAARVVIEAFDAVERADLRILPGGILQVDVTERKPAVLWRDGPQTLWMLDPDGHRIARVTARGLRADLPLIAGEGAAAMVPQALALFAAAEPIGARVRGLIRVGERRWDLMLDRDQRILLPASDPVRALEAMLALHAAQGLLARDLQAVDLRDPDQMIVRLAPGVTERLRTLSSTDRTGTRL